MKISLRLLFLAVVIASFPILSFSKSNDYGYVLAYVGKNDTPREAALHIACSSDGVLFSRLNNGKPVKYPILGTQRMSYPIIFRKADGSFGLIAIDRASPNVYVFDSQNLTMLDNERLVTLSPCAGLSVASLMECKYIKQKSMYRLRWKGSDAKTYESLTSDFKAFSTNEFQGYITPSIADSIIPSGGREASVIRLDKKEYNQVCMKFMQLKNVSVEKFKNVVVRKGAQNISLPKMARLNYSDGTSKLLGVKWNESDIASIDLKSKGEYLVHGEIQQLDYPNPLALERADPWVLKAGDGYYYFTATYPMRRHDDSEGYDRVVLRRARSISALATAQEITIWNARDSEISHPFVWAPEIHSINGTWYILFTTSRDKNNVWGIRPIVLSCTKGDRNPFNPECWETEGRYFEPLEGDNKAFANFSLDVTYFEDAGKHYVAWAEIDGFSNIRIATIDPAQPWKLTSKSMLLNKPQMAWEWDKDRVNEGPAVIKNDGKIYLAFSSSSVNDTYCVSYMIAHEGADLLRPESWTKLGYPVLDTSDLVGESGPGHNSFTTDQYGNPVIVYHSRDIDAQGDRGLFDPGRHARVRSVNFAADGMPIINMPPKNELLPSLRNVTIKVRIR